MEGRVQLRCGECGNVKEISGEIPEEYTECFARAVREEGWVPRPGTDQLTCICGACLRKDFAGHETMDDEEKVQGRGELLP